MKQPTGTIREKQRQTRSISSLNCISSIYSSCPRVRNYREQATLDTDL